MRGVTFSPVQRDKCWIGLGETTDPAKLAFFRSLPESFEVEPDPNRFGKRSETVVYTPEQLTVVVQGNAETPMHAEGVQEPVAEVVVQDPPPAVTEEPKATKSGSVWPDELDKEIVAHLVAAEWTPEDVKAARDAQLEALKGIGRASVKKIRLVLPRAK